MAHHGVVHHLADIGKASAALGVFDCAFARTGLFF